MSEGGDRKVALVTGATGGIGSEVCRRFAAGGWSVVLVDVGANVGDVASSIQADYPGVHALGVQTDITQPAAVADLAATVDRAFGRLDTVALVAGVVQQAAPVDELEPEEWSRVMSVNLWGPYLVCHATVPLLRRTPGSSITAVSSWWGRSGHALFSAYCSSKAALIVFAQSLAAELAPDIRVNTVCPGNINTPMHRDALASEAAERGISFDQMKDLEWAKIPLKTAGEPADIASAIAYLASEDARYVTGASLDVNGGVVFH